MKKYGLAAGIILLCVAACLFFLVGTLVPGLWWLSGIPVAALGIYFVIVSDALNKGKEKRTGEKEIRDENIKSMKQNLYEQLERDREAREKMLNK